MEADKKNEMERAALQAQLEKERAVAAKEKELQKEMMALRQESMRLSAELDYIKQHGNHQAARLQMSWILSERKGGMAYEPFPVFCRT